MACGKKVYSSKSQVNNMGGRIKSHIGKMIAAYWCPDCAGWHATSAYSRAKSQGHNGRRRG